MKTLILFFLTSSAFASGLPVKNLVCDPYNVSNPWLEDVAVVSADKDKIEIKFEAFPLKGEFLSYPGSETISYELEQMDSTTGWSWTATLSLQEYGSQKTRFLVVTEVRGGNKIRHEYTCDKK